MFEIFICLIVLMVMCGFGYVVYWMWQFVQKSEQAMYLFLLSDDNSTCEELDEIEKFAKEALRSYDKLGYIALSVREMDAYKEHLDNICYEIMRIRIKML